jgi:hypothetical protein
MEKIESKKSRGHCPFKYPDYVYSVEIEIFITQAISWQLTTSHGFIFPDQGASNCLDPGPSGAEKGSWRGEKSERPSLKPVPPDSSRRIFRRGSAAMRESWQDDSFSFVVCYCRTQTPTEWERIYYKSLLCECWLNISSLLCLLVLNGLDTCQPNHICTCVMFV